MILLKNRDEINRIRESGIILAGLLTEVKAMLEEGITTGELDRFSYDYIIRHKAKPAFLGYFNYPATLCVSINDEVIHGIPGARKVKRGDIVGVDVGVVLNGYISDACFTKGIGPVSKEREQLLAVTEESLYLAIEQAVPGNRIHDISRVIQNHARSHGYDVVRKYCGHGTGFELHEDPQVFNFVDRGGPNPRLKPGMVLAIEPMVNEGTFDIRVLDDGWTVVTADGSDSAHFEHTVAILDDHTEILTEGF